MTDRIFINKHSSICIRSSVVIYFDPFEITAPLNDADIIFITHEHYDHFDPASINNIKKENTFIVAPASMKEAVLSNPGMDESRCLFCLPGEEYTVCGVFFKTVYAYNPKKQFHTKSRSWLGYIVTIDGARYYIAGDTEANDDNLSVECDVALVPVGGTYTFDAKSAAKFVSRLHPEFAVPTHYGSVVGKLSDGPAFAAALEKLSPDIKTVLKIR